MKKKFNWSAYITIIGVVVILFIIFTDTIPTTYVLPVLGAICLMYGVLGLIQHRREKNQEGLLQRSFLQLILGAFIIVLGMIESLNLNLGQNFWNALLVILIILVVLWLVLRNRRK